MPTVECSALSLTAWAWLVIIPQSATVTTQDEIKLLQLKKKDLEELIEEHPVLFREIEDKISTYS